MVTSSKVFRTIDVKGEIPHSRFGHTITALNNDLVILFGGAIGDMGKYSMTADTYLFSNSARCWKKLNTEGIVPCPRAAHASTAVGLMKMVVYGGATGGSSYLKCRWKFIFR